MRIAQIAPLYESVPPKLYGGTERIVAYLSDELVHLGHHVTLFASGDSQTNAELVPCSTRALRLDPNSVDKLASHVLMLEKVYSRASDFDVIHFHIDYLHFSLSRCYKHAQVTTLHGRLDIPELGALYEEFHEMPVVSISKSQRKPLQHANWVGNVYHGVPSSLYKPQFRTGEYLVFLGRISREKRVDRAIQVAMEMGIELKIAAKIDPVDRAYFEDEIQPLFEQPVVSFLGELGEGKKGELLSNALALLFPVDWEEPFGLAMIEAMACGTPVIAWRRGSIPEVVDEGVTGFIVENIPDAIRAVRRARDFNRARCFQTFQRRFLASRMARDYVQVYEELLTRRFRKVS